MIINKMMHDTNLNKITSIFTNSPAQPSGRGGVKQPLDNNVIVANEERACSERD